MLFKFQLVLVVIVNIDVPIVKILNKPLTLQVVLLVKEGKGIVCVWCDCPPERGSDRRSEHARGLYSERKQRNRLYLHTGPFGRASLAQLHVQPPHKI
jgi:hypothetical protein